MPLSCFRVISGGRHPFATVKLCGFFRVCRKARLVGQLAVRRRLPMRPMIRLLP
jgi:hypothetical protein